MLVVILLLCSVSGFRLQHFGRFHWDPLSHGGTWQQCRWYCPHYHEWRQSLSVSVQQPLALLLFGLSKQHPENDVSPSAVSSISTVYNHPFTCQFYFARLSSLIVIVPQLTFTKFYRIKCNIQTRQTHSVLTSMDQDGTVDYFKNCRTLSSNFSEYVIL